jgi:hypothetical protein
MPTQFLNPPGLAPTNGWTQVVTSTGGKTIYVSGQVSVDERSQVVGSEGGGEFGAVRFSDGEPP